MEQNFLADKTALVTGGSRGIGRAVALKLAAAGASVVICGRTEETLNCTAEEIRAHGVSVWSQRADVSHLEDIDALFAAIESGPGGIDILVNNAVTSSSAPFDELTDDMFRYHMDVKLMAYIRIARAALPMMQARGAGRVVNVGGMTARIVAPLRMTNGVVNAGVANFTKQFAGYAARYNVTVNCVHPGYTATERVKQIFEREAKEHNTTLEAVVEQRTADIPLGRIVAPENIADAVMFFCSPWADMVTGQSVAVDGGSGESINY